MISTSMDDYLTFPQSAVGTDIFNRFLADCGVDGVKTDVQASLDELDNGADRYRITKAYQDTFKLASMNHFGRKVIYCLFNPHFTFPNPMLK